MDAQEFYEKAEDRILAIYPQKQYHYNAYIVGGRAGLENLRDAIDAALKADGPMGVTVGLAMAHPSDGETYTIAVVHDLSLDQCEEDSRRYDCDLPLPYYDPQVADQLRDGACNLAPDERYVMQVGVAHHVLNQRLKAEEDPKPKKAKK